MCDTPHPQTMSFYSRPLCSREPHLEAVIRRHLVSVSYRYCILCRATGLLPYSMGRSGTPEGSVDRKGYRDLRLVHFTFSANSWRSPTQPPRLPSEANIMLEVIVVVRHLGLARVAFSAPFRQLSSKLLKSPKISDGHACFLDSLPHTSPDSRLRRTLSSKPLWSSDVFRTLRPILPTFRCL